MARPKGSGPTSTSFRKGQSGNPAGRPKLNREVRALARSYALEAINTLAEIMCDNTMPAGVRVRAAVIILDRGHGRVTEHTETERLDIMTDAELDRKLREAIAGLRTTGWGHLLDADASEPEHAPRKKGPTQTH